MVTKWIKNGIIIAIIAIVAGGIFFGKDVLSYAKSSAKWTQKKVKESVPVEFELRRASDLLEEILPEMHANIKMIAQEEVEIAALKSDIERSTKNLTEEKFCIEKLSAALEEGKNTYIFNNREYNSQQVKADLTNRFERFKEAQLVHSSKQRLLESRKVSLTAAMNLLDKTEARKKLLENKIEGLESQWRLLQAAAVGSKISVDNSKLAQTEKLINQIKNRLDVAERVLAHESNFVETIGIDATTDEDLLGQIDDYFEQSNEPASNNG